MNLKRRLFEMYSVNDAVVYGTNGVCVITAIEERNFSGENIEYYILRPVDNEKNTFYVPVSNSMLTNKMHNVCTKQEINRLINIIGNECPFWIDNEDKRKKEYTYAIETGDRLQLFRIIKTIYNKNAELNAQHKKLHASDEKFFKQAENILYSEFAYSLDIPKDEVTDYIKKHI